MNLKQKVKNYGFWISLAAALILVLQTIGEALGFKIDNELIMGIVTSVCGVFVVLGIISDPTSGSGYSDNTDEGNKSQD
ncbi:MAG: phage holin [Spirochaetales bacterium]